MKASLLTSIGLATLAGLAGAQTYTDDFNLPDGTAMGADWSEDNGDFEIQSNRAVGVGFPWDDLSILRHNSYAGTYQDAWVSVDVGTQGKPGAAAGVCIGHQFWAGVATKIQDNDGDGLFDRVFFEAAINAGSWHGSGVPIHFDLTTPIANGRIEVECIDGDTAEVRVFDAAGLPVGSGTAAGILGSSFPPVGNEVVLYTQYSGAALDNFVVKTKSISASPASVSLAAGGVQTLNLNFGSAHAAELYLLLGSTSGTTPVTPAGPGIDLPLATDSYLLYTLTNPNSLPLGSSFGALDANGKATSTFTLPPAFDPTLVGITIHHAAISFDLAPSLTVTGATDAAPVTFAP